MSVDPDAPPPEHLGDLLGRLATAPADATETAKPGVAPDDFVPRIRVFAAALGEDPDELVRLARGTTPLARLVRLLMGEQNPSARVSTDQSVFVLHGRLARQGLRGDALWGEIVRQTGRSITIDAAKKALTRYRAHLAALPIATSVAELFSAEFLTDKKVTTRGPKRKRP